jgi:cell division protein FtsN
MILTLLATNTAAHAQSAAPAAVIPATAKKVGEQKGAAQPACYAVQVGAYEDRGEAEAVQNELARGFPNASQLSQVITGEKTRWRVRLVATSKVEALKIAARLVRERGIKAWVEPIPCS